MIPAQWRFDSLRLKRILSLPYSSEINMVISCGIRDDEGVYGKQIRVPLMISTSRDKVYL